MRRIVVTVALLCMGVTAPAHATDCGRALQGTWLSDAKASMAFNREHAVLEPRQVRFLEDLLGKMTSTFTADRVHTRLPDITRRTDEGPMTLAGFEEEAAYRILFCDAHSIVITSNSGPDGVAQVTHYHFTGPDTLWIYMGSSRPGYPDLHAREYFKRTSRRK